MTKLPVLTAKELCAALQKLGFMVVREEGGHIFLRHPDGRTTVMPNHPREEIDRGLLNKILKKDLRITREDLMKCL